MGEQDVQARVGVEDSRAEHVCGAHRRLERVADRVPQVVLLHHRQREAARAGVDEHERPRLLGGRPELAQAQVAQVHAARDGRDLDAAEPPVPHQLDELLGPLRLDGAQHEHTLARKRRQRLVLALDLDAAEAHPRAEDDGVDTGAVLLLEDPADVPELAQRRPDLLPAVRDDLAAVPPFDVRSEAGNDHMRVAVDDHATGSRPRTGATSTARGSWPRSSSITIAAFRPGPPVTEPPGCVVAPVW